MARLLVVEDSPTQAEELRLLLEGEGYTVEVACGGTTALQCLHSRPFHLVLSDVLMPDLSGYELCRKIKGDPTTRHLPVILLTQLNDPLDVLQGLECGADNFLTKPFDHGHLIRRVRDLVASRKSGLPVVGTSVTFRGTGVTITTEKEQILGLLLATVEDFVLVQTREREARAAKEASERRASELAEFGRRRDDHLAMLAHELRNPLAPLLTGIHLLRQAGGDPLTRERAVDRMERQVRHLGRLLDDLLEAARLAQGKISLRPERMDLARLVRTAVEDRRELLEQAGLQLVVETSETPVWHHGDVERLNQVLANLLNNAAKYTPPGGRVTVRLERGDDGRAAITVADTGPGIPDALLPRLFQPFAQGDQHLNRPGGGLGLGLAVVKNLVELHGGTVRATNAGAGRGAELVVYLPAEGEPAALTSAAPPHQAKGRGRKVLVVEDHRDAADSLCEILKLLGHDVRVAYTGPDGIAAALQFAPDVVISDIGLPGVDGYEVARRLRREPTLAGALLVALTGYGAEEDRRRSREAGFDQHLVKPADPLDLEKLLLVRAVALDPR